MIERKKGQERKDRKEKARGHEELIIPTKKKDDNGRGECTFPHLLFRAVGKVIIGQWKQGGEVFQAASMPNLTLRHNSISPQRTGREASWRRGGELSHG